MVKRRRLRLFKTGLTELVILCEVFNVNVELHPFVYRECPLAYI